MVVTLMHHHVHNDNCNKNNQYGGDHSNHRVCSVLSSSTCHLANIRSTWKNRPDIGVMPDETRLLEKRRQAFEAQEALDQRRAEYSQQEVIFKQREDALRAKDLELQASLTKFARFLQEADARRARALRKASEESRVAAQADARCHEVQRQLDSLEQQRTTINTLLQKRMQYGVISLSFPLHHHHHRTTTTTIIIQQVSALLGVCVRSTAACRSGAGHA